MFLSLRNQSKDTLLMTKIINTKIIPNLFTTQTLLQKTIFNNLILFLFLFLGDFFFQCHDKYMLIIAYGFVLRGLFFGSRGGGAVFGQCQTMTL